MAKTLLNAVNAVLKRTQVIAGDSGALSSLTDSARQHFVDVAVQVINEANDELYTASHTPKPKGQAAGTITLVTSTRAYSLASDLVRLRWPMIDKTNTQFLFEYSGGYNGLLELDPEQDDTGLPHYGAISPVDGTLLMDRAPTSNENGRVYTYQYEKSLAMSLLTDTVPYSDDVFNAMVPVWSELWRREVRGKDFDKSLYALSVGRAARIMTQTEPRDSWSPR